MNCNSGGEKKDRKIRQSACYRFFFSTSDMAKMYMYIEDIFVILGVTETYMSRAQIGIWNHIGHLCSLAHVNAFSTCLIRSHKGVLFPADTQCTSVHAEWNGYIARNWNLVKLLLSGKEIESARKRKRPCARAT